MQLHGVGCKTAASQHPKATRTKLFTIKKKERSADNGVLCLYLVAFPMVTAKISAICSEIWQQKLKKNILTTFNYTLRRETNVRAHMLALKSRHLTRSREARAAATFTRSLKVAS